MIEQAKIERLLRMIQLMSGPVDYTIGELEARLDMSRRTIYRYIDTFKDAGFVVEKTGRGVFRIARMAPGCSNLSSLVYFSEEEAWMVGNLIDHLDTTNTLKAGLHRKLAAIYDSTTVGDYVDNRGNAANVDALSKAVRYRKQAVLHAYESGSSGSVRDRHVEPFAFSTNFIDVWAYDLEDGRNKVFKISRIAEVEVLNEPWIAEEKHHRAPSDVFRLSGEPVEHVVLSMSTYAKNLLVEEYPLAERDVRKDGEGRWVLETDISQMQGVARFLMGLPADIEIVEGPLLKEYVRRQLQDIFIPKYLK